MNEYLLPGFLGDKRRIRRYRNRPGAANSHRGDYRGRLCVAVRDLFGCKIQKNACMYSI